MIQDKPLLLDNPLINNTTNTMDKESITIAETIKERLLSHIDILELKVYGSRAREDYTRDSDLDLFILVNEADITTKQLIRDIVWEISLEWEIYISTLILSYKDLQGPVKSSPVIQTIRETGISI